MNNANPVKSVFCMTSGTSTKQVVKSLVWLAMTTALYVVTLHLLKRNPAWTPGWRVALTLLPLAPGVFYLLSLLQSFRAMDELQRRIQVEAWIFALAGTVLAGTALNVLNANGVGLANYPHGLEIGGVYVSMFLLWSIGVTLSTLRYR